ncbi:M43 family zinc metalloprotease [Hymenobacter koreensis]|uniref:T9SS type A sorting domain-containing protein n=1 Tax=Hymenobacter koreensis TaxID=1084523 RepID=A0ABP8JMP5_9BACT
MKQHFYALALGLLTVALPAAAQNNASFLEKEAAAKRQCAAMDVLEAQIAADPSRAKRMADIEAHTRAFESTPVAQRGTGVTITIPVVVHVVYNTAAQNVSQAQIDAQIRVLNEDFAKTNADISNLPAGFLDEAGSTNVQFVLAKRSPTGAATTGVIRRQTKTRSFSSNDFVKYTSRGGSDAWPADKYLNLWLCNLGNGLLGYAQFPGGPAATDGVVCLYSSVPGGTASNYNKGRTATHEVGHWLNLRHIWGDATCGNDFVADTPTQQTSNGGCPSYPKVTCSNGPDGDMFMNYMDYTYDACMYMFTNGQSARMDALFTTGGARASLITSNGGIAPRTAMAAAPAYSLYPNPATDVLNLRNGAATPAELSVTVYDIHGLQLKGARYDAATGQLDVRNLPKGMYRLTIKNGDQVTQQSFIKE